MSETIQPLVMFILVFAVLSMVCGNECTVTIDGAPHTYATGGCR